MKALVLVLTSIFFAPVASSAQPLASKKIKVLSWNIYMLPGFLGTGKLSRAEAIGRLLAVSDYDVIVFQEAFHGNSRNLISRLLQPVFPFQAGPANQKPLSLKTNSGTWILSKYPIERTQSLVFKTRHGVDALSRKGALLVEINIHGQLIQVIGTHLQNSGSEWRRYSQCVELYNRLLMPQERLAVPQIICGDFNIDRYRSSEGYQYMLKVMNASDGRHVGTNAFSYDRVGNDMTTEAGSGQDLIDYILFRQADGSGAAGERRIRVIRHPWKRSHRDLSDHFALEAEISIDGKISPLVATAIK